MPAPKLICILSLFSKAYCMENKTILVELDGIIFEHKPTQSDIINRFGSYAIKNAQKRLFEILEKVKCEEELTQAKPKYQGLTLPIIQCLYLLNKIDQQTAFQQAKESVNTHGWWYEREYLGQAVECCFKPEKEISIMSPIETGVDLLKRLNNVYKNKLYLFSNKTRATMDFLRKKHPNIFSLLSEDKILTASRFGFLKPNKEAYTGILEEFNLKKEDVFVIESSQESLDAAKKVDIDGVLFENEKTIEKLIELKILDDSALT